MSNYCKECYKKQEEIEQLKKSIDRIMQNKEIKTIDSEIALLNAELQQENERLKEENYGLNQELLGYQKGVQASEIIELKQALQEIREIVNKAYYTEDYILGQRFTELVDAINLTITNIIGEE